MTLYERIHAAITDALRAGDFDIVTFNSETMVGSSTGGTENPRTVVVEEVSKNFEKDRTARAYKQSWGTWDWSASLMFRNLVRGAAFEEAFAPIFLTPLTPGAHPPCVIELTNAEYDHPERTSSRGTRIVYSFTIRRLNRR